MFRMKKARNRGRGERREKENCMKLKNSDKTRKEKETTRFGRANILCVQ